MKRLFILATAAIVALASCSKTQVVYNDAPEEIGFKAVTGVMTKADKPLGETVNMGVDAYSTSGAYFTNASFSKDGTYWTGGKYWPVSGELTFTVYAPYDGSEGTPGKVSYNNENSTLTITADNSDLENQKDWLYGKTQPSGSKATEGESLSVTLAHALSNVVVTIDGDAVVLLKKVELLKTVQKATGEVVYNDKTAGEISWENDATDPIVPSMVLFNNDSGTALSTTDLEGVSTCLVIPSTLSNEAIRLTYKLDGSASDLTYTTTVKEGETANQLGTTWAAGKKYTYNITIGAKEIKFNPTVTDWEEGAGAGSGQTIEVTPNS